MRIPILLCASVISMVGGAGCQFVSGVTQLEVTTSVSGVAVPLGDEQTGRISGAEVKVLEHPELKATTDVYGLFSINGVHEGEEVTLVMNHPDYYPLIQTGTHVVPVGGLDDLNFQAVTQADFDANAAALNVTPDGTKCQLGTSATRKGGTILATGPQGVAGVTVSIAPALPTANGPIYVNSSNVPDKSLAATIDGGGVVFVNVPPDDYVLSGQKAGFEFEDVKVKCRAGFFVIASAPRGMNVL